MLHLNKPHFEIQNHTNLLTECPVNKTIYFSYIKKYFHASPGNNLLWVQKVVTLRERKMAREVEG